MQGFRNKGEARDLRADVFQKLYEVAPEVGSLVSGRFFQIEDHQEVGHGVILEVPDEQTRDAVVASIPEVVETAPLVVEVVAPEQNDVDLAA